MVYQTSPIQKPQAFCVCVCVFFKLLMLNFIHLQEPGKTLEPLEGAKGKCFVATKVLFST